MARRRFLVREFAEGRASLEGEDARHLVRVLRARAGQSYELSDGRNVWLSRIETVRPERVEFVLVEELEVSRPAVDFLLLLSVIKFDRFEWVLEKATEFGVSQITPLAAERSVGHLLAAAPRRRSRWQRILQGAAEQSRRTAPPGIDDLIEPSKAFRQINAGSKILLSESPQAPLLRTILLRGGRPATGAALAVGPEGGWTEREMRAAEENGFQAASLGKTILRTETAALAALAVLGHELAAAGPNE